MRITVRESLISKMSRKLCDCWALPVLCCILVLGVPVCSSPQFPSARMRRASSQVTYEVDTLVVVDREFYTKWVSSHGGLTLSTESDIKEYVSLMVRQANVRLSNLQDRLNYNVAINVVAFQINVNVLAGIQPNIVTRSVSAEDALNSFFVWVSGNSLSGTYDHFILLTGFQLRDEYESHQLVSGRAYVGTLCNPSGRSLSVVHDLGGLQGAHTMAHELAHCLGSFHDGEASRNSCSKENRYIMAADDTAPRTPANQDHPWYFSTCSASAIDDFLHDIVLAAGGNDCLAQTSGPAPEFAATLTTVPGQRYVAHTQCQ
ncbi:A disintegrin and metalloproteinase with thrombospondin motifs 16, partial [Aplysia californica]|uniref:A disintegrin and metalloproteinase with thrombospondin motifs 16 n=1 Tax=Aplysia californica TaxID=6500 RepID=A0ABM1A6K2_APLCA